MLLQLLNSNVKARKLTPTDSPAAFHRRVNRANPFDSDDDDDAEDKPKSADVAPAPSRGLLKLRKGVRQFSNALDDSKTAFRGSSRELSPLVIEDTPEPEKQKMRVRVDVQKDCEFHANSKAFQKYNRFWSDSSV